MLLCAFACWAAAALVVPDAARAVIDDRDPVEGSCVLPTYVFKLQASPAVVGVPIAGSQVEINATTAKLVGTKATATRVCDTLFFPVAAFQWSVVQAPPGQTASISEANTLSPAVRLGGAGAYRIRLTACPSKCVLRRGGRSKTVGPFTRDVVIDAVTDVKVPPEFEPPAQELLPLSRPQPPLPSFSYSRRKALCHGGGGVKDPQWVTSEPFRGATDHRLLEGPVTWSKVADIDNFLNHDTQDFEWKTAPDPPYFGIPQPDPGAEIKTEWETGSLPRPFQPTAGDRASTFGFRIFDCGHDPFKAEIHPPVGVAVERPRAVQIPSSFRPTGFPNGFGSNVHVPGISTDVWFNRRSGETTRNCSRTGLHQPASGGKVGACIREPHDLRRTFIFNIYLPRNPQLRAQELGLNPPPVPLFVQTTKLGQGQGGADPTFFVRKLGGVTFLQVVVNGNTFSGDVYARRISAAWAYPDPANWGASRWRVLLRNMKIYDDSEPGFDDGDWRVFFNTNNRDQEWSKIIDCNGCIDDDTTRNLNLRTGASLGPDPVVFPGQPIFVHTTGYDDEVAADDLGTVFDRAPQLSGNYSTLAGGAATYRLNYTISPVGSVGPAALTPEARALSSAYTGRPNPQCRATAAPTLALRGPAGTRAPVCGATQQAMPLAPIAHPDSIALGQRMVKPENLEMFEPMEPEEFALTDVSVAGLRRQFRSLSARDRRLFVGEIQKELGDVPGGLRGDYNELAATLDRALPRRVAQRALPRSVRRSVNRFRRRARTQRRKRPRQRAGPRRRRSAAAQLAPGARVARLTLGELPARH